MKKGILFIGVLILIAVVPLIFAQSTNPWSADASGKEKNVFLPLESIYASSYTVCFGTNNISLYLIRGSVASGENLNDVRGQEQNIKTTAQGFILLTKIASNLTSGDYTVVLDCNNNKVYNPGENLDVFSVGVLGEGKAEGAGEDFDFSYDYDIGDKEFEMLTVNLTMKNEDVAIQSIELQANGTGNDLLDIEKIVVSSGGEILREVKFATDNGKAIITLDNFSIMDGKSESISISYVMKNFIENKTYSFSLNSINGVGSNSNQKILFSGLPVFSPFVSVGETKTCSGSVKLELVENSVNTDESVEAKVSGIENCSSPINVRLISCGNNVRLCELNNGTCIFIAPPVAGSYAVFACVDKNNDGLYNNVGETGSEILTVNVKEIPAEIPINTNTSITPITGNVIEGNETSSKGMSFNAITLLSIGMMVIFVILVVILIMLFKLAAKK